jgi:hypothetical protein
LKKGLVALAVTGALASPITANAAAHLKTFTASELQAGSLTGTTAHGIGTQAAPMITNDHLTVDKVYVNGGGELVGETIDLDATIGTPESFPGSARQDVTIAYAGDVTIPNEGTFTIDLSGMAGGLDVATAPNLVFVAQIAAVYNTGTSSSDASGTTTTAGGLTVGDLVEVGSVIDYTATDGIVNQIVIQIDTNRPELEGVHFVLSTNNNTADGNSGNDVPGAITGNAIDLGSDLSKDPFQQADALPALTQLYLASPAATLGEYNPITIEAKEGAAVGSFINATVSQVINTATQSLKALATDAAAVAEIVDGFALRVVDQATTTIDVESDRLNFINDDGHDEAFGTNLEISRAQLMLANNADYGIELDSDDTLSAEVARVDGEDMSGVESVTLGSGSFVWDAADERYELSATTLGNLNLYNTTYSTANFDIEVNRTVFLEQNKDEDADWVLDSVSLATSEGTFSVPVEYAEETSTSDENSVKENGVTHVWGVNGAEFKVPYVYHIGANTSDYRSIVKIVNEFAQDADVFVDAVIAPAGEGDKHRDADLGERTIKNVYVGTIPGEGHLTQNGQTILEALAEEVDIDTTGAWHLELTYTVNAPQDRIHAAAQNKSKDGRADTPVLYKTNNPADGRKWQ